MTAEHAEYYRTRPPRAAFAALEYGEGTSLDSHLVPIDVDNDPAALRARHPDRRRVAIVEATAVMRYVSTPGQPPFLMGRVTSVLPPEIHVPREWRGLLTPLQADRGAAAPGRRRSESRGSAPRLPGGTRLEPWITNVELLK